MFSLLSFPLAEEVCPCVVEDHDSVPVALVETFCNVVHSFRRGCMRGLVRVGLLEGR